MSLRKIICTNLKKIRKDKGYSQQYFAIRIGTSQTTYWRIESGKRQIKSATLVKIALILEVSVENLKQENWEEELPPTKQEIKIIAERLSVIESKCSFCANKKND